jgi:hypothetical protein
VTKFGSPSFPRPASPPSLPKPAAYKPTFVSMPTGRRFGSLAEQVAADVQYKQTRSTPWWKK